MIEILLTLLVLGAIAACIGVIPLPEWAKQVGYIVVGVCAVIVLVRFLWGLTAGGPIVIAP